MVFNEKPRKTSIIPLVYTRKTILQMIMYFGRVFEEGHNLEL